MRLFTALSALGIASLGAADPAASSPTFLPESPSRPHQRRGIAFNNVNFVKYFHVKGGYVKWCYNWDSADVKTNTMDEVSYPPPHSLHVRQSLTWYLIL